VSYFEKYSSVQKVATSAINPDQKREKAKKELEKLVSEFPNLSIRKAACAVNISLTLVYHIFHDDLHLKPYKYHFWHKLDNENYLKKVYFAKFVLQLPPEALEYFICSDEAYFI
jgi:hypothetical protein